MKHQVAGLLHASRYMRSESLWGPHASLSLVDKRLYVYLRTHPTPTYAVPLVAMNIAIIVLELLVG